MAGKAKTLQVKDKEKGDKAADAPEKDSAGAPSPLLDLFDAALIKQAKKRGFVTFDQLNGVLPFDTTSPEQIEDIMSMLSDVGINVYEDEDAASEEENKEEAKHQDLFSQNISPSQQAIDLLVKIRSRYSKSLSLEQCKELYDAVPLEDIECVDHELSKSGYVVTGCAWTTDGQDVAVSIKRARNGPFVLTKLLNENANSRFLAAWLPLQANDAVWAFSSVSHGSLHGHSGIALVRGGVLIDETILVMA